MIKSKSYNRIVFVTTLSLYLGLVLVSGTSPALAHSAFSKHFDVRNEIEYKDDFDNKPDEEKPVDFAKSVQSYFEYSESFIKDLQKLHKIEKFDLDYDFFELSNQTFTFCNAACEPCRMRSEHIQKVDNDWLIPAVNGAISDFNHLNYLSDCLKDIKSETDLSAKSNFKLSYSKSALNLESSFFKTSPQNAEQASSGFNYAIKNYKPDAEKVISKELTKNTFSRFENNQVFIVTRLPRGSIDSLLK